MNVYGFRVLSFEGTDLPELRPYRFYDLPKLTASVVRREPLPNRLRYSGASIQRRSFLLNGFQLNAHELIMVQQSPHGGFRAALLVSYTADRQLADVEWLLRPENDTHALTCELIEATVAQIGREGIPFCTVTVDEDTAEGVAFRSAGFTPAIPYHIRQGTLADLQTATGTGPGELCWRSYERGDERFVCRVVRRGVSPLALPILKNNRANRRWSLRRNGETIAVVGVTGGKRRALYLEPIIAPETNPGDVLTALGELITMQGFPVDAPLSIGVIPFQGAFERELNRAGFECVAERCTYLKNLTQVVYQRDFERIGERADLTVASCRKIHSNKTKAYESESE